MTNYFVESEEAHSDWDESTRNLTNEFVINSLWKKAHAESAEKILGWTKNRLDFLAKQGYPSGTATLTSSPRRVSQAKDERVLSEIENASKN